MTLHPTSLLADGLPHETPMSVAFSVFIATLTEFVATQRDLEDINYSLDPAYAEWNHAADDAQDRLMDITREMRSLPLIAPEDIPLRRLVLLVDAVRGGANAELLLSRMQAHFCRLFQVTGRSATAYHRNLLLQWSRPVVEAFAALPLFEDRREEDALPPDPQGE